ncbi:6,7-dimethyl-8-ribityllumazine synthase [Blochmannia endosymbiont of Camponotus sp.]|uniref:6,7-dimethyl-8-ribityllumazine synthase n=1 Tax=Blochmannia endosymbiont of Camponotus sp. TaxID=700220 RepID=UPI002024C5F9|nr:6,7-dimethyl-8-ribityllumazine synthase [Blochmannia endosymbiont of Camponotus sp.]URJ30141.1 6,7-dimethyl-8-ribityllumazine synthase [Blochmannia endosymbiont of Camponotus sp.]
MNIIEGGTTANKAKISIAVVRFNRFINNNLLEGALDILKRIGHIKDENITIIWVPGAYELPLIAKALAISDKYDGIIALGTVIRGITLHFELIAKECSSGLSNISIENTLPIGFGLLTTDNISQAIERSGVKSNNKGSEAALAVLEMINILQIIKK